MAAALTAAEGEIVSSAEAADVDLAGDAPGDTVAPSEVEASADAEPDSDDDNVGVSEALLEVVAAMDEEAPRVSELVALGVCDGVSDCVAAAEEEDVALVLPVAAAELDSLGSALCELVGESVAAADGVPLCVPVCEGDTPLVSDAVAVGLREAVSLPELVPVPEVVDVAVADVVAVSVEDAVTVAEAELLAVPEPVWLCVGSDDGEEEGVSVTVPVCTRSSGNMETAW